MAMIETTRRGLITGAAGLALGAPAARAQLTAADETLPLWPAKPPGASSGAILRRVEERSNDPAKPDRWVYGIERPALVVRRPAKPNGSAVLLVPGGGYGFLAHDNEGLEQAAWLNAIGVTAFILLYRLPGEGWSSRATVPLQDAQRAMRLIRANAGRYGVERNRIAVLGFSAGGHLAGSLATRHAEKVYSPVDAADGEDARPDLAGLVYPVVSLAEPFTHGGSRDNLLGPGASVAARRIASVETRVGPATPPVFLIHASDDGLVPEENSIALYTALRRAERPAELHLFDAGGHGFGVRLPASTPASAWPRLFAAFAARHGVFPAPGS
jgi:acetyl esterase/lipase